MEHLTAAGGVLFREDEGSTEPEVLLIYRRGVWDLPKGKLEENENVCDCAVREVSEEVGCKTPEIRATLTETYHEYQEGEQQIGKTTHWYAMALSEPVGEEDLEPETREGIQKLEWVPISEAAERVGYENLEQLLAEFKRWYAARR